MTSQDAKAITFRQPYFAMWAKVMSCEGVIYKLRTGWSIESAKESQWGYFVTFLLNHLGMEVRSSTLVRRHDDD